MKKGAMKVVFGVAAAAFLAAPLASFAGGTIAGKVTYAGKAEQKEFSSRSSRTRSFVRRTRTRASWMATSAS